MTPYCPRQWGNCLIYLKAGFSHKGVVVTDHNQGFVQVGAGASAVGSQQQRCLTKGGTGAKCGVSHRLSITWELARQLSSQTPPRSTESEAPGERPSHLC